MGKLGKKLVKQQQKNKEGKLEQEMNPLRRKVKEQIQAEQYADAINTLAELAKLKCMDPEVMYEGAYCYFMLGDYERTATWIDNTLNYAPDHRMARVLLARLCLLEERTEDGLAIFDFVLEHYRAELSEDTLEEIEEILEYYARNEADKLRRRYPHIAAFMKLDEEPQEEIVLPAVQQSAAASSEQQPAAAVETAPLSKAQAAVAALKNLMAKNDAGNAATDSAVSPAEPGTEAVPAAPAAAATELPMSKAKNAVAALKGLMDKTDVKDVSEKLGNAAEAKFAKTQEAMRRLMQKDTQPAEAAAANSPAEATAGEAISQDAAEILQQSVSIVEKIRLLHARAGEAFVSNRLSEAQSLLQAALELDSCNESTLRNLALVSVAGGNREQAVAYALRMTNIDFLLLDRLRVH